MDKDKRIAELEAERDNLVEVLRDLLEAVGGADKVLRGDFYHERKAARAALAPYPERRSEHHE